MSELHMSCKDCCFLQEINNKAKSQYDGCKIGKLELLVKNGASVFFEDGSIPIIKGRVCNCKRNQGWIGKYEDNWKEQLEKEIEIEYGAVIDVNNTDDLKSIVEICEKETIQPRSYYIIYRGELKNEKLLLSHILNKTDKQWYIKTPLDQDVDFVAEYARITVKEPFIYYIYSLDKEDKLKTDKINNVLNKELKQIMMISNHNINCQSTFIPTNLIKILGFDDIGDVLINMGHTDKICII